MNWTLSNPIFRGLIILAILAIGGTAVGFSLHLNLFDFLSSNPADQVAGVGALATTTEAEMVEEDTLPTSPLANLLVSPASGETILSDFNNFLSTIQAELAVATTTEVASKTAAKNRRGGGSSNSNNSNNTDNSTTTPPVTLPEETATTTPPVATSTPPVATSTPPVATSTPPTATTTPPVATTTPPVVISNLIINPSFEVDNNGTPANWQNGSWGNNSATFTYPVTGSDDDRAVKITLANYIDGDAKWYFDDVNVKGGSVYAFSNDYLSTVPTDLLVRYTYSDNTQSYNYLITLPATGSAWASSTVSIMPPAGAVSLTVFHMLTQNGELSTDNFFMYETPTSGEDLFGEGIVSLTFDDGWVSHYDNVLPILTDANLKATFYLITSKVFEAVDNLIPNNTLEQDQGDGTPVNWLTGNWGSNTATFTYPAVGPDGAKAAAVTLANYVDGDAKWYFTEVPVEPAAVYRYRDTYQADAPSLITAQVTNTDDSISYIDLKELAAAATWKVVDFPFAVPASAKSLSIFHRLASEGTLTITRPALFSYSQYLNVDQAKDIQNAGQEIGSHTITHPDLSLLSNLEAEQEMDVSHDDLVAAGFLPITSLAYPYGNYSASVKNIASAAGYTNARTVIAGFNNKASDKLALRVQSVEVGTSIEAIKSWIDAAVADKTWLILVFHQTDHNNDPYGTTPETLQEIANYLNNNNVTVKTVDEVLPLLN